MSSTKRKKTQSQTSKEEEKPAVYWVVEVTHFTDDYKPRGGDWSHSERVRLFSTREKAESCLCKVLVEQIEEHIQSYGPVKEDCCKLKGYPNCFDEDDELKKEVRNDFRLLSEMVDHISEGEFVNTTFSYHMYTVEVDSVDS